MKLNNALRKTNLRFDIASVKNFKEFYVENSLEKNIFRYANTLLEGNFSIGYDSISPISFDATKIDFTFWQFQNQRPSNTYLLYAFGLRPVYILARAFEITDEFRYFQLASTLIGTLHSYLISCRDINAFAHNDHANAERVENLVYYGHVANEKKVNLENREVIFDLLMDCRNWLYDDRNYQQYHNHGILADKGLIIAAYCINDEESQVTIDHAIKRLKEQIAFGYGNDSVHLENSFDYHIAITNQVKSIRTCLEYIRHPFSAELKLFLDKTYDFLVYAYKPNLQRPLFGDSKGTKSESPESVEYTDNLNLLYIATKGEKGVKPQKLVSFFSDSGYIFLREHFEKEGFSDSTWLSLKSGFKSRIHKHQDDLSICLYSKGSDIFIDSGMYNFMHGDKLNQYMESVAAHTTVGVLGKSYSIAKNNGELLTIQQVAQGKDYDYVLASSRAYMDCAIYRHLFYFRQKNILIIYDEIHSDKSQIFVQYFHLSPNLKALSLGKDRSVFQIANSGYSAVITQLEPVNNFAVLSGTRTDPMSILSTGFSEYTETKSLQYFKKGNNVYFISVVEIKSNEFAQSTEFDLTAFSNGKLSIGDFVVSLPQHLPVTFTKADIISDELTLKVRNYQSINKDYKFALYIYDHNTKQIVKKLSYTSNDFLEFIFTQSGEYDLLYYVSNKQNEKVKGILASIHVEKNSIQVVKKYKNLHRPIVGKLTIFRKSNKDYDFTIPIKYDFSYKCKWWVYREGVNLPLQEIDNLNKLSYKFVEPGDYAIMCSISDQYFGEFFFDKSKAIHI